MSVGGHMQYSNFNSLYNTHNNAVCRAITTAELLHFDSNIKTNVDSLVRFPAEQRVSKQKWVCNISKNLKFSEKHEHYLQIDSSDQYSQFEILCRLLRANNCHVIYFDAQFSINELTEIRRLQSQTKTELINSRVALCLSSTVKARKSA